MITSTGRKYVARGCLIFLFLVIAKPKIKSLKLQKL